MASVASHQDKSPDAGDHIMVAGLAFQVATLFMFQPLCLDFMMKTLRRMRALGDAALDPKHAALRGSAQVSSLSGHAGTGDVLHLYPIHLPGHRAERGLDGRLDPETTSLHRL